MKRTIAGIITITFILTQGAPAFATQNLRNPQDEETRARADGENQLVLALANAASSVTAPVLAAARGATPGVEVVQAGTNGAPAAQAANRTKTNVLSEADLTLFIEKLNYEFHITDPNKRMRYKVMSYKGSREKKKDIEQYYSWSIGIKILLSYDSGYEGAGFGGEMPYLLIRVDRNAIETIGDLSKTVYHQIEVFKRKHNSSPGWITDASVHQEYKGYYCDIGLNEEQLTAVIERVAVSFGAGLKTRIEVQGAIDLPASNIDAFVSELNSRLRDRTILFSDMHYYGGVDDKKRVGADYSGHFRLEVSLSDKKSSYIAEYTHHPSSYNPRLLIYVNRANVKDTGSLSLEIYSQIKAFENEIKDTPGWITDTTKPQEYAGHYRIVKFSLYELDTIIIGVIGFLGARKPVRASASGRMPAAPGAEAVTPIAGGAGTEEEIAEQTALAPAAPAPAPLRPDSAGQAAGVNMPVDEAMDLMVQRVRETEGKLFIRIWNFGIGSSIPFSDAWKGAIDEDSTWYYELKEKINTLADNGKVLVTDDAANKTFDVHPTSKQTSLIMLRKLEDQGVREIRIYGESRRVPIGTAIELVQKHFWRYDPDPNVLLPPMRGGAGTEEEIATHLAAPATPAAQTAPAIIREILTGLNPNSLMVVEKKLREGAGAADIAEFVNPSLSPGRGREPANLLVQNRSFALKTIAEINPRAETPAAPGAEAVTPIAGGAGIEEEIAERLAAQTAQAAGTTGRVEHYLSETEIMYEIYSRDKRVQGNIVAAISAEIKEKTKGVTSALNDLEQRAQLASRLHNPPDCYAQIQIYSSIAFDKFHSTKTSIKVMLARFATANRNMRKVQNDLEKSIESSKPKFKPIADMKDVLVVGVPITDFAAIKDMLINEYEFLNANIQRQESITLRELRQRIREDCLVIRWNKKMRGYQILGIDFNETLPTLDMQEFKYNIAMYLDRCA